MRPLLLLLPVAEPSLAPPRANFALPEEIHNGEIPSFQRIPQTPFQPSPPGRPNSLRPIASVYSVVTGKAAIHLIIALKHPPR